MGSRLGQLFVNALSKYSKRGPVCGREDLAYQAIVEEIPKAIRDFFKEVKMSSELWTVKGSVGQGNWSFTPWVGIFNSRITDRASKGYYVVFLMSKSLNSVTLSLANSTTDRSLNITTDDLPESVVPRNMKIGPLPSGTLGEPGSSGEGYERAVVLSRTYSLAELESVNIEADLIKILNAYTVIVENSTDSRKAILREMTDAELDRDYWTVSPGRNAEYWDECLKDGIITIGWDEFGDLKRFRDQDEIESEYYKHYGSDKKPVNNAKALFEFAHVLKTDDVLLAKDGLSRLVGIGIVTSDYYYDPQRPQHHHVRTVKWMKSGQWELPEGSKFAVKTLTNITDYPNFVQMLLKIAGMSHLLEEGHDVISEPLPRPVDSKDLKAEVFFSDASFDQMIEMLNHKKNIILQGPPGVGKTFVADRLAFALMGEEDRSRLGVVQFHPSYSYEDFMQGYRPDGTGFVRKDGVFFEFCEKARRDQNRKYVFVIDEINRGNLSKIFGELMLLIEPDKRGMKLSLTYSREGESFSIPENVYIIGTMNTADRSLSLVDYALRRRFVFFTLRPEFRSQKFMTHMQGQGLSEKEIYDLIDRVEKLNFEIRNETKFLGPGFEIGHSYFCRKHPKLSFSDWLILVAATEIEPLLSEYWCDSPERVDLLGKEFKRIA